ncbi:MAG: SRPBCC domain-containing protein, partial [Bacteroidota bacterium]
MTSEKTIKSEESTDLVLTREFNAPKELVFKAWTQPEHLAHWWGPVGFTLGVAQMDLSPGGTFLYSMKNTDGIEMWGKFVYKEVSPFDKLVFVNSFSDKEGNLTRHPMSDTWPLEVYNVLTLEEFNGKTKLTLRGGPVNANETEIKTFSENHAGMQQGFKGTL